MATLWFVIIAIMLTVYVALDGFDLGAGVIYLIVAKTRDERRMVLRSIGPVWDGNEVWLVAAAGTLYFAFPQLYASSFSGFYLPLMMVLWLLMLRAIGIEFRGHIDNLVWQNFFDVVFSVSSALLTIFFGAALGNVVRGVPLDHEGYFFEPLWTNFKLGPHPGILDWYTILIGVLALVTLTVHGALYVALKTENDLSRRARDIAVMLWPVQLLLTCLSLIGTYFVRPHVMRNYGVHPVGALVPIVVVGSLAVMAWANRKEQATEQKQRDSKDKLAFLGSTLYITGMLVGVAFALYPLVLPSSTEPGYSLTINNSAAGHHGLVVGLIWWIVATVLALGYFLFVYRLFRGKVRLEGEGY
ncbi:MAG TPA: cytochrome d ubiquinol oxidase subunit II [Terriglobales bacterium]|jgi:cytochrome bd ubiquinol oxidase subunit II|nr:cytochrome d ubiquinol oxidase subunit II [Terriglobales bacterium]